MAALHLLLPFPSIFQAPSSSKSVSPLPAPRRRPGPARPGPAQPPVPCPAFSVGREDIELSVSTEEEEEEQRKEVKEVLASPEHLEYTEQIKRVLELLRKNRDMTFGELTIIIEDPRDNERKRLLGIEDDEVTRDDLAAALEDVCSMLQIIELVLKLKDPDSDV